MASTFMPKTMDAWMRRIESRVSRLERRRRSARDGSYVLAAQANDYAPGFTGEINERTLLHEIYMGESTSGTDTFLLDIDVQIQCLLPAGAYVDVEVSNETQDGTGTDTVTVKRVWNFDDASHTMRDSVDGLFKVWPDLDRRYLRIWVDPGTSVTWQNSVGPSYRIQGFRTPFTSNGQGGMSEIFPDWTQNL